MSLQASSRSRENAEFPVSDGLEVAGYHSVVRAIPASSCLTTTKTVSQEHVSVRHGILAAGCGS